MVSAQAVEPKTQQFHFQETVPRKVSQRFNHRAVPCSSLGKHSSADNWLNEVCAAPAELCCCSHLKVVVFLYLFTGK